MSRLPTVIYTHGGGRLGNQLLRFAHWLAWVEEHHGKVALINAGFWPYARHFTHWSANMGCGFPDDRGWCHAVSLGLKILPEFISRRTDWRAQRAIHAAGGILRGWQQVGSSERLAEIDLDRTDFLGTVRSARVTTCAGWRIAGWETFARHEKTVRTLLEPNSNLVSRAGGFIEGIRERAEVVAGVLIRQGDYRVWREGRHYHPTSRYVGWMRRFAEMQAGRQVAFVVTSDEVQDPGQFAGLDVVFSNGSANSRGHAIDALLELARCDAVLSPPSTFSAWAAHWGRVPLWAIPPVGETFVAPIKGDLAVIRQDAVFSEAVA